MGDLAQQYEQRFPDTGVSDAQKEERMERMGFREEAHAHRRTGRTRGILVPRLPWLDEEE